jgi:hypothetical protein
MVHWKTTIMGLVAFAVGGAAALKWISPEQGTAITGMVIAALGAFAADSNKVN